MTPGEARKKICPMSHFDYANWSKCLGDDCMAWQWHITISDSGESAKKEKSGYCGMVRE